MSPLRDCFVCCCKMFCSPQWQRCCCTSRSLGRLPARCLDPCVWCCCWVPCTARLCRLSPAGGPQAVQLPAIPPAPRAEGGSFLIVRRCTHLVVRLTQKHAHTPCGSCIKFHVKHADRPETLLLNMHLYHEVKSLRGCHVRFALSLLTYLMLHNYYEQHLHIKNCNIQYDFSWHWSFATFSFICFWESYCINWISAFLRISCTICDVALTSQVMLYMKTDLTWKSLLLCMLNINKL